MSYIFLIFLLLLNALTWADLDLLQFCLNKKLNEVVAHPQDCAGFIVCSEVPTVQFCQAGFHFDMNGLVCNWPNKVNCQLSSRQGEDSKDFVTPLLTPFAAYDIMTGLLIEPMVGFDPFNVACRHFGSYFLPNPQKCRSYYLCAYGHIHEHGCGDYTLWDYKLQKCVLSHLATCYRYNEDEATELNLSIDNISMICYPTNLNSNTSAWETIQLTSTKFTPTLKTTIAAIETTTTPLPTPPKIIAAITLPPTTTEKTIFSNPFNIVCPPKRQSYVAHPEDCSKYFICIKGIAVMTSCPQGLLWDSKKFFCDFSKNVQCVPEKI